MAIGKASDFKIYEPQYYGGAWEGISQIVDAFNAASRNALRLVPRSVIGQYEKESFWKSISGLIAHRDTTSVAGVTDGKLEQDENVSVKVARKIGPIAQTLDAWRKIGSNPQEMSFQLGRMIAAEKAKDYINSGILAAETAISGVAALNFDATGGSTKTLTHGHLVSGMAKLGDYAQRIVCWVMHSKPFFDLMQQAITDKVFEVAGATIIGGNVASLGRPTIVIDSPALWDLNGSATDTYNVLGLVENAAIVTESETEELVSEVVTGLENLVFRVQGEYAFNLAVQGFSWDVTNGGANPVDATLGTSSNWDSNVSSAKLQAGVRIKVQ